MSSFPDHSQERNSNKFKEMDDAYLARNAGEIEAERRRRQAQAESYERARQVEERLRGMPSAAEMHDQRRTQMGLPSRAEEEDHLIQKRRMFNDKVKEYLRDHNMTAYTIGTTAQIPANSTIATIHNNNINTYTTPSWPTYGPFHNGEKIFGFTPPNNTGGKSRSRSRSRKSRRRKSRRRKSRR